MDKQQFYAKVDALDADGLAKVLWTLYWRGSVQLRERIEAQLEPEERPARRTAPEPPDSEEVLDEVREFVQLARSGAYMGGDRRVSPKERTRWRFTFRRLMADAEQALTSEDPDTAATALGLLIDLAQASGEYDFFRSEDPVQAAGVVISDVVGRMWASFRDRHGFAGFAERAAPQLLRWEAAFGWTRYGSGSVADKETSLAQVLAGMLAAPDHWAAFAAHYLEALDRIAAGGAGATRRPASRSPRDRARELAEWHDLLLNRLVDSEDEGLLDRLVVHRALAGPERTFLQAGLAERRGDADEASRLVHECLKSLPGHRDFLALAVRLGAPVPPCAREPYERLMAEPG